MATTNYITGLNGTDNTTYYLNEGVDTRFFRGTCSTAKGTAAKTVTLDDSTNFSLTAGVKIAITFINGSDVHSTAASLNVNSTGAKTVIVTDVSNTALDSTSVLVTYDDANIYAPVMVCQPYEVMFFVYNGTNWVQIGTSASVNFVALHHSWLNADRLDIIGGSNNIINVQHGGTGVSSFTKNSVVISGSTSTSALTTRSISDSNSASAISSSSTSIPTERDIYYGLPTINNVHDYTSSSTIYAPSTAGTSGQVLSSSGSGAPTWVDSSTVGPKIQIVRW